MPPLTGGGGPRTVGSNSDGLGLSPNSGMIEAGVRGLPAPAPRFRQLSRVRRERELPCQVEPQSPMPAVERAPMTRIRGLGADGILMDGSLCSVVAGSSPTGQCFRRIRCDVLWVVVLVGSGAVGEQAVRLQPEELGPGRADPAWCRAEAALAKHRGDDGVRDVDAELQEFAPDPEVSPPRVPPDPTDGSPP